MTWLHTWIGLLTSWLLYFVFVTGTLGYFDSEIDLWMKPEVSAYSGSSRDAVIAAESYFHSQSQPILSAGLELPLDRTSVFLRLYMELHQNRGMITAILFKLFCNLKLLNR